jgi:hypothetical protein
VVVGRQKFSNFLEQAIFNQSQRLIPEITSLAMPAANISL